MIMYGNMTIFDNRVFSDVPDGINYQEEEEFSGEEGGEKLYRRLE